MALNSSGPISLGGAIAGQSINLENGNSATAQVSLNDSAVRNLAGIPSGTIIMPTNFWGKSNIFTFNPTISSNVENYNLLSAMQAAGYVNGSAFTATVTVGSGVYIWSDSTSLPGFDTGAITGTGTITIINNGFIIGKGGAGATAVLASGSTTVGFPGNSGGPALSISYPVTIDNTNSNAYVAGGGGGGAAAVYSLSAGGGGGGAGGGAGGNASYYSTDFCPGGIGGAPGSSGGNSGTPVQFGRTVGGGGGGRILPGVGGAAITYVSGQWADLYGRGGGSGGSGVYAVNFSSGSPQASITAGGGGWGASGGTSYRYPAYPNASYIPQYGAGGSSNQNGVPPNLSRPSLAGFSMAAGGVGGKAVSLNGNSVTWVSGDTTRVWGAVS